MPRASSSEPSPSDPADGSHARGVRWDLADLYAGPDDPALAADAASAERQAAAFAAGRRGTIASADADTLAAALAEYEAILELAHRPGFYASLLAAADTQNPAALDLEQRTSEQRAQVQNLLVFFELELTHLDDGRFATLVAAPALADYAHYLRTIRRFKSHVLSEAEERVINRKDLGGREAFVQLYDELVGSLRFRVPEADGTAGEEVTESEVFALLHQPDRPHRQRAMAALLATYAAERLPLTGIWNAVLLDHRLECEMRGYHDLAMPTHLANEVEPAVVAAMMDAVDRHVPVIQEYLRLKARLLGLPRLQIADLHAPLDAVVSPVPFAAGRQLVLEAFDGFDPLFAGYARRVLDAPWLDAEVRTGKQPGAFCAALGPSHHPYVLTNYADTGRDVATLAHELGHAVHGLAAHQQRFLNYDPPLVLAETASVFAEMVVTDHLLARAPDAATRRRLLVETLDEMYGTVFRQHALTRFEVAAHAERRSRRLSADDLATLWMREQTRLFGDTVEVDPAYGSGWSYIPHFVHSRFYCYSYAFGELLTLALFQRYKAEGPAFLPHYRALLASGGAVAPVELGARLGFDLASPAFWDGGCAVIRAMVEELRRAL